MATWCLGRDLLELAWNWWRSWTARRDIWDLVPFTSRVGERPWNHGASRREGGHGEARDCRVLSE